MSKQTERGSARRADQTKADDADRGRRALAAAQVGCRDLCGTPVVPEARHESVAEVVVDRSASVIGPWATATGLGLLPIAAPDALSCPYEYGEIADAIV